MIRLLKPLIGIVAVAAVVTLARRRATERAPEPSPRREVHVPRASGAFDLDSELTEPAWRVAPVAQLAGRPYSEVRFTWSGDALHVGLYASDRNIVSAGVGGDGPVWRGDSFHLVFAKDGVERSFDVGPSAHGAVLTDGERRSKGAWSYAWSSGARVALDMDEGTADHPEDADEEWVVELEIPLAALGLAPGQRVDFSARRCDVDVRGGKPVESPCPAIELALVLDP